MSSCCRRWEQESRRCSGSSSLSLVGRKETSMGEMNEGGNKYGKEHSGYPQASAQRYRKQECLVEAVGGEELALRRLLFPQPGWQ